MIRAERRWISVKVIEALPDVMVQKGVPEQIRSDNGPEFVARALCLWLINTGAKVLYIEPGSRWENGYGESFHSKLRDEFLNGENLLLDQRATRAGRTLAHPLQHRQTALLAELSASGTGNIPRARKSGKHTTLLTFPRPRRRPSEIKNVRLS